jgi:UDP-N-acetylglucosamine--N-acetylmuramyl-(pentapeptide) pyrophosphoryl-undecaprenol N-acetylglucosamine transferase
VPRVVIAAGGTAGHVVPALAVAEALRDSGAEVSFLGTRDRVEARLVPEAGYEIDYLNVRGLDRRNPLGALSAAVRAAAAVPGARGVLRRRRADAVMGGGGYVSGPAGLAALASGVPLVLTEADSHLGLANRMLASRARRVCLAFPIEGRDSDRYVITGRPVPAAVLSADRDSARRRYGIAPGERCLLVFGGSQGARSINETALAAFAERDTERDFHVLHIAGSRDLPMASQRLRSAGTPERYTLLELEPSLGDPLAASDLVVARAGGSVFELAAAGKPAILVPYPRATAGHQQRNAAWMAEAGAAVVLDDGQLAPEALSGLARSLLGDPERLEQMATASRSVARPDAARRIAAELLSACEKRR